MAAFDLVPGAVLAERFRLDHLIGEGGMATIWAAEDVATGRRVALKLMKDVLGEPDGRRRLLQEARAAQLVRHRHVVEIFEVLELEAGPVAIVMELLDGEPLRSLLQREHRLALGKLADILVPVISAVGASHALGIVHRDLKPENIFLARDAAGERVVKVLDFGIAKLTALDGEAMRSTGLTTTAVLGTPAYMAPEQVFGERDIDHRADIWALGVVVYECLSGVRPTEGDNVGQVLKHVLSKPFTPLDQLLDGVPPEVSRLVDDMLARERSQRPPDLHAVLAVLQPFAGAPGVPFDAPAQDFARGTAPTVRQPDAPGARPRGGSGPLIGGQRTGPGGALAPTERQAGGEPSDARRPARRRGRLAAAAALASLGAGAAAWSYFHVGPPLAEPATRLACPILRASGVEPPADWLGAAAAAMACERARVILGGQTERTLVPADLLDLPRAPTASFPREPYGAPGVRELTIAAAQRRAQAYLDGAVTASSPGFKVVLSLHRPDGDEIARSEGDGRALYEAVRAAMAPLIGAARIPRARHLDPAVAAWARTDDIDAALGVTDLTFAFVQNAGGLPDECRRFDAVSARVAELGAEGRWLCASTLGQPVPAVNLDASDPSDAGRATRIRIDQTIHQTHAPGDASFLRALFQREPTARGRSLLAATESCLLQSTDPEARARAIAAVQSEPKNLEGGSCSPWEQLLTVERDTMEADGATRAWQGWMPWSSYAWLEPGYSSEGRDPAALPLLRRAHALSPLDAQIADMLVRGLLTSSDPAAARGVAAELQTSDLAIHRVASELISIRIDTSEARFGTALARARRASEISGADSGWVRAQRFEIAWHALEVALVLGRAPEVADLLVERFLDPAAAPLDGNLAWVPMRIAAICALASAPEPCLARFESLRAGFAGAITPDTEAFRRGVELYVHHDLRGAAKAWRPLLAGHKLLASALPDALAEAFDQDHAPDLADEVDREVMKRAGEFHGATLGDVRAARRASARGDRDQARRLAAKVVTAWSVADDEPPALAEMRQLAR